MEDTDVVAEIAHDMRTPLAIILGLCDRLEDGDLDADAAVDVGRVKANAELLARDFDRLLERPRGAATAPGVVDLTALVWEVTRDFRVLARARGQELKVPPAPVARVLGIPEDLRSLLTNLISNALRHAPDGGNVRCAVSLRGNRVLVDVADDGPGIAPAERSAILEPYVRGATAADDDGGHGLGLAIVRRVVDAHHGRLTIDTAPEGGALFTVALPAHVPSPALRHRLRGTNAARTAGVSRRRWR